MSPPAVVTRTAIQCLALAAATSLLVGCISLFPQADPAQLYRFGATVPQAQETASGAPGFDVFRTVTAFDRAAAHDRILTGTSTQAAYIEGARLVTSAGSLFGYTAGRPLADCGKLGSLAAGLVIQQIGPRPRTNLRAAAQEAGLL